MSHFNLTYEIDKHYITVTGDVIYPQEYYPYTHSVNILLPGWSTSEKSVMIRQLAQKYSDISHNPTIIFSTRAHNIIENTLYYEAEAVSKYIKENKFKEILIIGYSQGGTKSIFLASKCSEVKIKGLILLLPVGLYKQSASGLTLNFLKDIIVQTPVGIAKEFLSTKEIQLLKTTYIASRDIILHILKEVKESKLSYLKRFKNEVKHMAEYNKEIENINVPVILIQGYHDPVSKYKSIIEMYKNVKSKKEKFTELKVEESRLKEKIFKKSPYVKVVTPQHLGHHGLPYFKPQYISEESLKLLKEYC